MKCRQNIVPLPSSVPSGNRLDASFSVLCFAQDLVAESLDDVDQLLKILGLGKNGSTEFGGFLVLGCRLISWL